MKKIIAFSLWGKDKKYTVGAIKNAELLETVFPGWKARFYCGTSVPEHIIKELKSFKNVEVEIMSEEGNWNGMFWRFYPASEKDVSVMLSRDTDSRLNEREKLAVDEWLKSDKDFHIMRDHPWHGTQILGGMWGVRNGLLKDMKSMIEKYSKGNFWQVDQNFLKEKIYPIVREHSFVHDEFFNYENWKRNFPQKRKDRQFVGEAFSYDDVPNSQHRSMLR
jgi:hypothetical protein